jgi:enterochelin esterase-like enzyme
VAAGFDRAIRAGQVPPHLVVFVNGLPFGMYCDALDGSAPVESMIVRDLVPHIDATHRTVSAAAGRLLEGFSMGGYGAARLGFKYPETFGAVSILGGGPLQPELNQTPRVAPRDRERIMQEVFGGDQAYFLAQSPWHLAERLAASGGPVPRIRLIIGRRDEMLGYNRDFHVHLTQLGIAHNYREVLGVGHEPLSLLQTLGPDRWTFYGAEANEPLPDGGFARATEENMGGNG